VPAVVEGFKKIRVAFFKINDWINDCICNLNLIYFAAQMNISDVARFFCEPRNDSWVGGWSRATVSNPDLVRVGACWVKLIDIQHNLGERWADGLIAVPAEAEELLYSWIGEA